MGQTPEELPHDVLEVPPPGLDLGANMALGEPSRKAKLMTALMAVGSGGRKREAEDKVGSKLEVEEKVEAVTRTSVLFVEPGSMSEEGSAMRRKPKQRKEATSSPETKTSPFDFIGSSAANISPDDGMP